MENVANYRYFVRSGGAFSPFWRTGAEPELGRPTVLTSARCSRQPRLRTERWSGVRSRNRAVGIASLLLPDQQKECPESSWQHSRDRDAHLNKPSPGLRTVAVAVAVAAMAAALDTALVFAATRSTSGSGSFGGVDDLDPSRRSRRPGGRSSPERRFPSPPLASSALPERDREDRDR